MPIEPASMRSNTWIHDTIWDVTSIARSVDLAVQWAIPQAGNFTIHNHRPSSSFMWMSDEVIGGVRNHLFSFSMYFGCFEIQSGVHQTPSSYRKESAL